MIHFWNMCQIIVSLVAMLFGGFLVNLANLQLNGDRKALEMISPSGSV